MKSIPTSKRANICVLSESGLSARQIESKTGLGKSTVARVIKELIPEKENIKLGRPSKLFLLTREKLSLVLPLERLSMLSKPPISSILSLPLLSGCIFKGCGQEKEASLVSQA